jgi:hypothetical protein
MNSTSIGVASLVTLLMHSSRFEDGQCLHGVKGLICVPVGAVLHAVPTMSSRSSTILCRPANGRSQYPARIPAAGATE